MQRSIAVGKTSIFTMHNIQSALCGGPNNHTRWVYYLARTSRGIRQNLKKRIAFVGHTHTLHTLRETAKLPHKKKNFDIRYFTVNCKNINYLQYAHIDMTSRPMDSNYIFYSCIFDSSFASLCFHKKSPRMCRNNFDVTVKLTQTTTFPGATSRTICVRILQS